MLGLAGYPEDRAALGLAPDAPVYLWDTGPLADDASLIRNAAEWDAATGDWRLRPAVRELVARWPGQTYYTLNEPAWAYPPITARRLAELHALLAETVDKDARLASPGFQQVEWGISWWGDERYDVAPDGRLYSYAEAWLRWLSALGGRLPDILSWHAYPQTRYGQRFADGRSAVGFVRSVGEAVSRLRDRYPVPSNCRLILSETGWIDWSAGGPAAGPGIGWTVAKSYMAELVEAYLRSQIGDDACWFISRSEADSAACEGAEIGGWPGYLRYGQRDPTGRYGTGVPCQPWWWSTVRCEIGQHQGEPGGLTPLGELWRQGAARAPLTPRLWLPVLVE